MSGQHVPYQLRTNKFVDRQLFLDLLEFVRVWNGSVDYIYVSMGGPFLEDFKHVNERLAIETMISLEVDANTWARQKFNTPYGFVECRKESTGEFITNYDAVAAKYNDERFVVWLDYANANDRNEQLQEVSSLVDKLSSGDLLKVTLNANHQSTRKRSEYRELKDPDFDLLVSNDFREQLSGYLPEGSIQSRHLRKSGFADLLAQCLRSAVIKGTEHTELTAVPLLGTRYCDSDHQMVTVTVIIADQLLKRVIEGDARFQNWPFRSVDWTTIHEISMPQLSAKERWWINQQLERDAKEFDIHQSLGFLLADHHGESIQLIRNYVHHYRRYPGFGRIQS